MTGLKFKNNIDGMQMSVLLYLLKSWDVEVEILQSPTVETVKKYNSNNLPFSTGMWEDYDIDDKSLRAKAWGTNKRVIS